MYLKYFESRIKTGNLHLHMPDKQSYPFGKDGARAHWHIHSSTVLRRIISNPGFELGQTYMEGGWDTPDLRTLLQVLRANFSVARPRRWYNPLLNLLRQVNRITDSYRNISHHYDVSEQVFRLFLDQDMYYSCAFFRNPNATLEQAQADKAAHIARKLLLQPGMRVLDIGSGWGSLAFHLASRYQVEVTGITLSREQLRVARQEARQRGLDNVHFMLSDYREHSGSYDRVVSVGMLEHVGAEFLPAYFKRVKELLASDGVALIHSIGNTRVPGNTNAWINRYIFPGGLIPSLSQMAAAVEHSGLITCDVESWRQHYGFTLRHWYERFLEHRDTIRTLMDSKGEGEIFCRMWEFYLAACESAFMYDSLVVYQYQLATRHGLVPLDRDYLSHTDKNI